MKKGGDSGPGLVPGKPEESSIVQRIKHNDETVRMPQEGVAIGSEQVQVLETWIRQGARVKGTDQPEADPRDHWSFRPPRRSPIVDSPDFKGRNPIDVLLEKRQAEVGLVPASRAYKATLLRRVTLDLIGVPPTLEELRDFLADSSPGAFEKVVDRLLGDPRYGERWARHWMDVWRYADWHGRRHVPDVWNSAPQIWRWRDWIVDSLNGDHGYDRMVREMIAADEIAPGDRKAAVATGYLIRNWYALNPNDWMRSTVEHTGKAFLGLTFQCAHCHDHKYDPISQLDYFRLRAFFEPMGIRQDRVPGQTDPGPFQEYSYSELRKVQRLGQVQIFDKNPSLQTWIYTGGDERNRDKDKGPVMPGMPKFLGGNPSPIQPVSLPGVAVQPWLEPEFQKYLREELQQKLAGAQAAKNRARKIHDTHWAQSEKDYAQARTALEAAKAKLSVPLDALSGTKSLLVDGRKGPRALKNGTIPVSSSSEGLEIRFLTRILTDGSFNVQLARDLNQGLTATFVSFEKGSIRSYHPGGFQEIEVGRYDLRSGEDRFQVGLVLQPQADQALLTVRCLNQGKVLVEKKPIALNGWNPANPASRGVFVVAKAGTCFALDDLLFSSPSEPKSKEPRGFTFESPLHEDLEDVVGIDGWEVAQLGPGGGQSLVTSRLDPSPLLPLVQSRRTALAKRNSLEEEIRAIEAEEKANQAALKSLEARSLADRSRRGGESVPTRERFAKEALVAYLDAQELQFESDRAKARLAFSRAQALADTDSKKPGEMDAARKALDKVEATRAAWRAKPPQEAPPLGPVYPDTSTGRRKALALWLTDRSNPLTARVAVNHLWLRHFHQPLVATVFDFGRNGATPTHPELLDHLAVWFMDSGWSMKRMHRLMVTSETYQRSSTYGDRPGGNPDPENQMLGRMNVGRMEAEVLRDSILHLAGALDLTRGGQELENDQALKTFRRSLYYSCQPELDGKSEFGALFDAPEPADCYKRTRSIIPQQSLALTNSGFVQVMAEKMVDDLEKRLAKESRSDPSGFVALAFEKILGRLPRNEEQTLCLEFLNPSQPTGAVSDPSPFPDKNTKTALVRVLLNHNDFLAIR